MPGTETTWQHRDKDKGRGTLGGGEPKIPPFVRHSLLPFPTKKERTTLPFRKCFPPVSAGPGLEKNTSARDPQPTVCSVVHTRAPHVGKKGAKFQLLDGAGGNSAASFSERLSARIRKLLLSLSFPRGSGDILKDGSVGRSVGGWGEGGGNFSASGAESFARAFSRRR